MEYSWADGRMEEIVNFIMSVFLNSGKPAPDIDMVKSEIENMPQHFTEDQLWEVIDRIQLKAIDRALWELSKKGLVNISVDDSGEFYFCISEEGERALENNTNI